MEPPDLNAPPHENMLAAFPNLNDGSTGAPIPSPLRKKWFTSAKYPPNPPPHPCLQSLAWVASHY